MADCHCEHEHEHKHEPEHKHETESLCGCEGCGHDDEKGGMEKREIAELALSALFMAAGFCFPNRPWVQGILFGISALISGLPVMVSGVKGLLRGKMEENLLMTIAAAAAFCIGQFFEGAAVTLFFRVGEAFEEYASRRSRKQIRALSEIRPDTANLLLSDGTMQKTDAKTIPVGSRVAVLPHERVALDGIVIRGSSALDAAAITGESLPIESVPGLAVASGTTNGNGTLEMETTALFADSSASRIIQMVEEAVERKGTAHKTITRFARIYTPAVVILAALLFALPSLVTGEWRVWLPRALGFLVASCPCALVLSVPLGFFAGMGAAAKQGIIIKGGVFVETLAKAKIFLFDKTGTLTTGEMQLTEVFAADGYDRASLLRLAAACEWHSAHPLAAAILTAAKEERLADIDTAQLADFSEIAGGGTAVRYDGKNLLCGGAHLMRKRAVDVSALPQAAVYLAVDGKAVGAFAFSGAVRPETADTLKRLRSGRKAVRQIEMLTGDNASQAEPLAKELGIDVCHANLLPQDKLRLVQERKDAGEIVVYTGDGINDAPVLALSDAGVAMGLGTQAASEAADVILTSSKLSRLADARIISRRTMSVVNANIIFSLAVKIIVLALEVTGIAGISAAVFADVGVLILTVLNASRLLGRYGRVYCSDK